MRRLIRSETAAAVNQKLLTSYERVTAENAILRHQLARANEKLVIQKKRAPRGKPLFEAVRDEGEQKALFASPSKIDRALQLQAQKEVEVQTKITRKQELAIERRLAKQRKELEKQERKAEREKDRIERLTIQATRKATKEVEKEQKAVSKQLLLEAKQSKKSLSNKEKQIRQLERPILIDQAVNQTEVLKSKQTRIGRQTRPPQHLQGYEI